MGRGFSDSWRPARWLAALPCAALCLAADAGPANAPADAAVRTLFERELADVPRKEVLVLTVDYPPGGASLPHRHDADVFVYVLSGRVVMQVAGQAARTLSAGETFYEGPTDVHVRSANDSRSAPARLLVFMVKDQGAPVSRPAAREEAAR